MPDAFFNSHQRATIEAAMARIIPTDDTPGAREAGCIDFLDRYLSGLGYIFAKPDGSGFEMLEGSSAEAWMQRIETMRARYIEGDPATSIPALTRIRQLISSRSDARAAGWRAARRRDKWHRRTDGANAQRRSRRPCLRAACPAADLTEIELEFLPLLVTHTRQGFYSDPIYGGNKGAIGWKVIGFPGPGLADGGLHWPLHRPALFRRRRGREISGRPTMAFKTRPPKAEVCIIGAGASGAAAAKVLTAKRR